MANQIFCKFMVAPHSGCFSVNCPYVHCIKEFAGPTSDYKQLVCNTFGDFRNNFTQKSFEQYLENIRTGAIFAATRSKNKKPVAKSSSMASAKGLKGLKGSDVFSSPLDALGKQCISCRSGTYCIPCNWGPSFVICSNCADGISE
jgi:hypothetical protein